MKIGPPSDNSKPVSTPVQSLPAKGRQSTPARAAASQGGSPSAGVAVTVSTLARTLAAAHADEAPEIDAEKVSSVRAAIQQGTYKVNAEAIADKLLANAQEILKRSRG